MDMEMQYDMAACEEEGEEDAPRRSEKDDDGGHARRQNTSAAAASSMDGTGDAVPGKTGGVEAGYKGRARRGKEKAGGYDLTPNRRGPRKVKGARIRYVEEDERGGGTTEQGIRMGPVSVQRVAKGRGRPRGWGRQRRYATQDESDGGGALARRDPHKHPNPTASGGFIIQHLLPPGTRRACTG